MAVPGWVPPSEFDEYRLQKRLGHGSMGQVWLARDTLLDRRVAIKFLADLETDPAVRERFLIEARAIARLAHPNVVSIHRVGTIEGQPYAVTELVDGESLDRLEHPVPVERALSLGVDLARGLAAAHRAGILHRDVKPANAILGPDGAKLLDFGLAKLGAVAEEKEIRDEETGSGGAFAATAVRPVGGEAPVVEPSAVSAAEQRRTEGPVDRANQTLADGLRTPRSQGPVDPPTPIDPGLTRRGSLLGTPYYLAPECWSGEPATRRSDIYSFGGLLYELVAGGPPAKFFPEGTSPQVVAQTGVRPLSEVAPQVEGRFAAIIERCLHRDPHVRFASGDEVREALERLVPSRDGRVPEGNPYRGLLPFEAEHRALFFGRSAEVRSVIERLRTRGIVVVAGESGTGKSSLCRAGVLPALREGALGGGRMWLSLTCVPGARPLRALASTVAELLGAGETELYAELLQEPSTLARRLVKSLGPTRGLVLFVDQLEEWVSFADPEEAAVCARAVMELGSGPPGLRVLATARTDLLPELTRLPGLGSELSNSLFLLGPVQKENLAQIVEGPAQAHGARFESAAMVQELVDFAVEGGALPLLQFALARLWQARQGSDVLTVQALREMGGVSGALARHADHVVERLPQEQATQARALLVRLVSSGDQRRRRPEAELLGDPPDPARRAALAVLANERIVLARDSGEGKGWEIAHEVLLREWPTLRRWLSDDAEKRAAGERLSSASEEWERLGRPPEALWGARQLAESERHLSGVRLARERAFLQASRRRVRVERWRVPLGVGALLLAAGVTFFAQRWSQARALEVEVRAQLATARTHQDEASRARVAWEALREQAYAAFDHGDWPGGEKTWSSALERRDAWVRSAGRAAAGVEGAFFLAPQRREVRGALAEVVAEKHVLARLEGRGAEAGAELERLRGLEDGPGLLQSLEKPAVLVVSALPPSTRITVTRVADGATLTAAQLNALTPGSYWVHAQAPRHVELRAPVVLEPGETLSLPLELLPEDQVPSGFVHIPRGRFLFGAGGDEKVRREFYEAAPIHPVELPTFLIGQHEVTFSEWLSFLDELPAAQRSLHLPNTDAALGGTTETAFQALARTSRGWQLTFAPISQKYIALEGSPISYLGRTSRSQADWRRFPVTAITPRDMEAYLRWLDSSGRVPGARLCTEHEWERAARGADGRTFPHGDLFQKDDANLDETYGYQDAAYGPDEVGAHPSSASPFGVQDLLGNAWEVVRSVNFAKGLVVRGGSWHVGQISARIPNSWVVNADFRQVDTGFRVCAPVLPVQARTP